MTREDGQTTQPTQRLASRHDHSGWQVQMPVDRGRRRYRGVRGGGLPCGLRDARPELARLQGFSPHHCCALLKAPSAVMSLVSGSVARHPCPAAHGVTPDGLWMAAVMPQHTAAGPLTLATRRGHGPAFASPPPDRPCDTFSGQAGGPRGVGHQPRRQRRPARHLQRHRRRRAGGCLQGACAKQHPARCSQATRHHVIDFGEWLVAVSASLAADIQQACSAARFEDRRCVSSAVPYNVDPLTSPTPTVTVHHRAYPLLQSPLQRTESRASLTTRLPHGTVSRSSRHAPAWQSRELLCFSRQCRTLPVAQTQWLRRRYVMPFPTLPADYSRMKRQTQAALGMKLLLGISQCIPGCERSLTHSGGPIDLIDGSLRHAAAGDASAGGRRWRRQHAAVRLRAEHQCSQRTAWRAARILPRSPGYGVRVPSLPGGERCSLRRKHDVDLRGIPRTSSMLIAHPTLLSLSCCLGAAAAIRVPSRK